MTNIVSFPTSKLNEAEVRALVMEGDELVRRSRELTLAVSDWENRFLEAGERYLQQGGKEPTLVKLINTVKIARKFFCL
jgi:hypothetical protein